MYIIIIGTGRTGGKLANILSDEHHNIVAVDKRSSAFDILDASFNGITIEGNGIDEDVLKEAGIEKADAVFAMTDDDNTNIMASQVAKNFFDVERVITKINNQGREYLYKKLGLETINVTNIGAFKARNVLLENSLQRFLVDEEEEVEVISLKLDKKLLEKDLLNSTPVGVEILSIMRQGEIINICDLDKLQLEDKIIMSVKGKTAKDNLFQEEGGLL